MSETAHKKRLMVDRLQCLVDTAEWSADEVYLLVASAATRGRAELRLFTVAPEKAWQGLGKNTDRGEDVLVDADYRNDRIYVAALLEQDGRRDLDPPRVLELAGRKVEEIYRAFASTRSVNLRELTREICVALDAAIKELGGDDQHLARSFAVPLSLDGAGQVLLAGHDHRYRMWFKLA